MFHFGVNVDPLTVSPFCYLRGLAMKWSHYILCWDRSPSQNCFWSMPPWKIVGCGSCCRSVVVSSLRDLKNRTGVRNFLFHGTSSRTVLIRNLGTRRASYPNHRSDFGPGNYLTADFMAALCYTGDDGVIRVYDYRDGWGICRASNSPGTSGSHL